MRKKIFTILLALAASVGMSWATTTDLASISDDYTAQNGEILTGTLGVNVKISIADGATVTLLNANINGDKTWTTGEYAGLTCLGDATITIVGKNSVSGFYADDLGNAFPGIYVPSGKTLIINGTGSLTAQSSVGNAAGIGAKKDTHCGNIEIQSGKITAIACGERGAGIGGAYNANCGNITISGGIVTAVGGDHCPGIGGGRRGNSTNAGHCGNILISGGVVSATSGEQAAAIGGGRGVNNNYKTNCGTITITNTALKVYADQGGSSTNTIGAGKYGTCGTVTIGGNTGVINNDPYTYRTKEDGEIVVDYINAIGTVVYTQECKDKIDIARELYDALGDSQKALVTNYQVLLDAEAAYAALIPQPSLAVAYTLQLHVNDALMGSVALQNPSNDIIDNGDGTYTVPEGAEVTLQATPNDGYQFTGWKAGSVGCDFTDCGNALSTVDNPLTFDMNVEVAIMAEFAAVAPQPQPAEDVNITPNVDPENPTVYYSTFFDSENKYALPTGVEAYIVTTVSGDAMQLQKVADAGQTIQAGEGVILKASVTPFTLTPSDADAVSVEGNRLEGSDISIATPANCYVLAGNEGVGFYHYTASMLNPHKAYIIYAPNSGNQAPRRLRFAFETATGVENVQGDNVQSTKVIENGVLYIIKNGVKFNAQGQVVK